MTNVATRSRGRVIEAIDVSLVLGNLLRPEMCAKLGYDADEHYAQMHRDDLARFQLPVLGLWEGESTMCEYRGPNHMMLVALPSS